MPKPPIICKGLHSRRWKKYGSYHRLDGPAFEMFGAKVRCRDGIILKSEGINRSEAHAAENFVMMDGARYTSLFKNVLKIS